MLTCTLLEWQGHDDECQAHQLLGACLAALSAATGLRELSLHNRFSSTFSTAGCPAGLRSLRRLEIDCPNRLLLDGLSGIEQLTGLQELSVSAQWMEVSAEVLPVSLTRVTWRGDLQDLPLMRVSAREHARCSAACWRTARCSAACSAACWHAWQVCGLGPSIPDSSCVDCGCPLTLPPSCSAHFAPSCS